VLWDITHEVASRHLGYDLPLVSPEEAGRRLARLSDSFDLVLYETFLPDLAGHGRLDARWVLERLDAFLGVAVEQRPADVTVVVSSDHGNLEDLTTRAHTANPVPLLAIGPGALQFNAATDITDVTPGILALLACPPRGVATDQTTEGDLQHGRN
jgi:2,3-bisphosphoglycerate-independent phosphoglycerate mutase